MELLLRFLPQLTITTIKLGSMYGVMCSCLKHVMQLVKTFFSECRGLPLYGTFLCPKS